MNSREPIEGAIDFRSAGSGPKIWLLTSKFPLIDESNRCNGIIGISLDISREKENEQALKEAIETLEETKLQLIESQKLRTVGKMAAGIAHEVKNPLNIISLGIEYLKEEIKEPPDLVELMADVTDATNRANRVVMELLDLSTPTPQS